MALVQTEPKKVYLGGTEVSKIFLGSNQVRPVKRTFDLSDYQELSSIELGNIGYGPGLAFSLDGKQAIVGRTNTSYSSRIYTCNSPYEIFSYQANANGEFNGLYLKPDGTEVFCARSLYNLYDYSITGGDFRTMNSGGSPIKTNSLSSTMIYGVWFSQDGKNLYTSDDTYLYQWSLSTAWDISTIASSYVNRISLATNNVLDIAFDITGTVLYATIGRTVQQYSLGTAWDISTINTTPTDTLTPLRSGSNVNAIWGITFSTDYKYMAISGRITSSNGFIRTYKIP